MKAVEFPEVNLRIGETQEQYQALPVFWDSSQAGIPVTMCFELDEAEVKQVAETGKVWVTILTFGHSLQPIMGSFLKPDKLLPLAATFSKLQEVGPICPQCENPYPHSHKGGGYSCEECGHEW